MPLQMEIDSRDLQRLKLALHRLGQDDLMPNVLKAVGMDIMGTAKRYPPAQPRRTVGWWYERGWGWQRDGIRQEQTSERLGDRWYTNAFPSYSEVGNLASYAGWVHGDVQRPIHERHGWRKLYDVAQDELPELVKKAKAQIKRIWEAKV